MASYCLFHFSSCQVKTPLPPCAELSRVFEIFRRPLLFSGLMHAWRITGKTENSTGVREIRQTPKSASPIKVDWRIKKEDRRWSVRGVPYLSAAFGLAGEYGSTLLGTLISELFPLLRLSDIYPIKVREPHC